MKLEKSLLSSWLRLYSICAPCGSETRILASGGPDCRILILTSEDWNAREFFTSLECKKWMACRVGDNAVSGASTSPLHFRLLLELYLPSGKRPGSCFNSNFGSSYFLYLVDRRKSRSICIGFACLSNHPGLFERNKASAIWRPNMSEVLAELNLSMSEILARGRSRRM